MSLYTATYNEKDEDGNTVDSHELSVEYDFGSTLDDAVELFSEEIVLAHFKAHAVVSLQSRMRSAAKLGQDVQEAADGWKPGQVTRRGKSPVEKAMGAFEKMSDDQQQAFIEQLKEAAG
jgi:hypothetical protein